MDLQILAQDYDHNGYVSGVLVLSKSAAARHRAYPESIEDVPEDRAVLCPLKPGEASFHHG